MSKVELTKEMIQSFIMHPDWRIMESYILEHFANSTEIDSIDISNDSTAVHAEVIARQSIDRDVKGLLKSFDVARAGFTKKKKSYE